MNSVINTKTTLACLLRMSLVERVLIGGGDGAAR
jgi:hypothetical protein